MIVIHYFGTLGLKTEKLKRYRRDIDNSLYPFSGPSDVSKIDVIYVRNSAVER